MARVTSQELQRRLDQTLGKPGSYLCGLDRGGHSKPMTVGTRLYRVEQHLAMMDKKVDQILLAVQSMAQQQHRMIQQQQHHHHMYSQSPSTQPLLLPPAPSQTPSPIPMMRGCLEDDV